MIRLLCFLALGSLSLALSQQARPQGISVYTWVREDIFAGFIADDLKTFQTGVDKLDALLKDNPDDPDALVLRGISEVYRAVRAHEAGRKEEYAALYRRGAEMLDRAYALRPKGEGVLSVIGGTGALFADRLPAEERTRAWQATRARYAELLAVQEKYFDRMPAHMRGEVLGGLAQAEQRLGNMEAAQPYLTRILSTLPQTPYEAAARKWVENPESASKSKLVCQSCHEPGRLQNRLAALQNTHRGDR